MPTVLGELELLLTDEFNSIDPITWRFNEWRMPPDNPSFYGDTQQEQALPGTANGVLQLKLESYIAGNESAAPEDLAFEGNELISRSPFSRGDGGIFFEATARFVMPTIPPVGGAVGGLFLNETVSPFVHSEIDFEILSNEVRDGTNRIQTNVYEDEGFGAGNPSFHGNIGMLTDFHTYRIEWLQDVVRWYVDGVFFREETESVPNGELFVHFNIWGPSADWAAAFDAGYRPTTSPHPELTRILEVDSVRVGRLAVQTGDGGDNLILGSDLNEWIDGGGGADVLSGGGGSDTIFGREGNDVIFFDDLDVIQGGGGLDRAVAGGMNGVVLTMSDIEWLWGTNAADVADATVQNVTVTMFGLGGDDTLTGGSGDDQLYGQNGADSIFGGGGDDWLYIDSQDIATGLVRGGSGSDRAASLDGSALSFDLGATNIEWVWASNLADNLDGTTQINPLYLFAFDGPDTLRGGSGPDNLYGQAGTDAMYGGVGNDVLYFDSDDTVVDGGADFDTAQVLDYTGVGVTLNLGASHIEVVYASNQADTLNGSTATWALYMNGYNGDDVMSGGSGADNIFGGGGADTISGGGGNDFLDGSGGPEVDTLVVTGPQADYVLHYTGGVLSSVQDLVTERDGWDNVSGFERIQFSDHLLGS